MRAAGVSISRRLTVLPRFSQTRCSPQPPVRGCLRRAIFSRRSAAGLHWPQLIVGLLLPRVETSILPDQAFLVPYESCGLAENASSPVLRRARCKCPHCPSAELWFSTLGSISRVSGKTGACTGRGVWGRQGNCSSAELGWDGGSAPGCGSPQSRPHDGGLGPSLLGNKGEAVSRGAGVMACRWDAVRPAGCRFFRRWCLGLIIARRCGYIPRHHRICCFPTPSRMWPSYPPARRKEGWLVLAARRSPARPPCRPSPASHNTAETSVPLFYAIAEMLPVGHGAATGKRRRLFGDFNLKARPVGARARRSSLLFPRMHGFSGVRSSL